MDLLKRNEKIIKMFSDPDNLPTLQEVADKFGITRERVRQILNKYNISDRQMKPVDYKKLFDDVSILIKSNLDNNRIPTRRELNDVLGFSCDEFLAQSGYSGYIPKIVERPEKEQKYSDEQMIQSLNKIYDKYKLTSHSIYDRYRDKNDPHSLTIINRFGSWLNALTAAGINKENNKVYKKEYNINPIIEYARFCIDNNISPTYDGCLEFSDESKNTALKLRREYKWSNLIKDSIVKVYKETNNVKNNFRNT